MNKNQRTLLRAAILIHEHLASRCRSVPALHVSECSWATIERFRQGIALASRRGWHDAARRLGEQMADAMHRLQLALEVARQTIESHTGSRKIPSPSEIYRDLSALEEEFDVVEIDLSAHEIVVTTACIVLDDIDLGAFSIRLDWRRLDNSSPYRVVARDPNPASRNEGVTHPHVQDETLCEGDGRAAIQAALAQGRLYDFFLLVSQVLHTYARGAAYVELDLWNGISCTDCGTTMDPDDSYSCQRCGSELCEDCRQICAGCEEAHCAGCLSLCPGCDMDFCRGCLDVCDGCHKRFCNNCLEDGLCPNCQAEQSEEEEENKDDEHDQSDERLSERLDERTGVTAPSASAGQTNSNSPVENEPDTAVEPHRLGEALVSA